MKMMGGSVRQFKHRKRGFAALDAGPVGVEVPVAAVGVGERGVVAADAVECGRGRSWRNWMFVG